MSQLFGMNQVFTKLQDNYDAKVNKTETENTVNKFDTSKLSKKASGYLDELKTKYGNAEVVVVDSAEAGQINEIANSVKTDKDAVIVLTSDELEKMATDETIRTQNEKLIDESFAQLPEMMKKLNETGIDVTTFGMMLNGDGTASYFALADKGMGTVTASSIEELIQKMKDMAYEKKADTVMTENEKQIGQTLDLRL